MGCLVVCRGGTRKPVRSDTEVVKWGNAISLMRWPVSGDKFGNAKDHRLEHTDNLSLKVDMNGQDEIAWI